MNDLIRCILKGLIVRKSYEIFSELVALILFVSIFWVLPTNSYEEPVMFWVTTQVDRLKQACASDPFSLQPKQLQLDYVSSHCFWFMIQG